MSTGTTAAITTTSTLPSSSTSSETSPFLSPPKRARDEEKIDKQKPKQKQQVVSSASNHRPGPPPLPSPSSSPQIIRPKPSRLEDIAERSLQASRDKDASNNSEAMNNGYDGIVSSEKVAETTLSFYGDTNQTHSMNRIRTSSVDRKNMLIHSDSYDLGSVGNTTSDEDYDDTSDGEMNNLTIAPLPRDQIISLRPRITTQPQSLPMETEPRIRNVSPSNNNLETIGPTGIKRPSNVMDRGRSTSYSSAGNYSDDERQSNESSSDGGDSFFDNDPDRNTRRHTLYRSASNCTTSSVASNGTQKQHRNNKHYVANSSPFPPQQIASVIKSSSGDPSIDQSYPQQTNSLSFSEEEEEDRGSPGHDRSSNNNVGNRIEIFEGFSGKNSYSGDQSSYPSQYLSSCTLEGNDYGQNSFRSSGGSTINSFSLAPTKQQKSVFSQIEGDMKGGTGNVDGKLEHTGTPPRFHLRYKKTLSEKSSESRLWDSSIGEEGNGIDDLGNIMINSNLSLVDKNMDRMSGSCHSSVFDISCLNLPQSTNDLEYSTDEKESVDNLKPRATTFESNPDSLTSNPQSDTHKIESNPYFPPQRTNNSNRHQSLKTMGDNEADPPISSFSTLQQLQEMEQYSRKMSIHGIVSPDFFLDITNNNNTSEYKEEDNNRNNNIQKRKLHPKRWNILIFMSILNILSGWSCFSVAPIASIMVNDIFSKINYTEEDFTNDSPIEIADEETIYSFDGLSVFHPALFISTYFFASFVSALIEPVLVSRYGLKGTIVLGAFLSWIGNWIKSGSFIYMLSNTNNEYASPKHPKIILLRLYLGFLFGGLSQPMYYCTCHLVASNWFTLGKKSTSNENENQRCMAYYAMSKISYRIGILCAFIVGSTFVRTIEDIYGYFNTLTILNMFAFFLVWNQFEDFPSLENKVPKWSSSPELSIDPKMEHYARRSRTGHSSGQYHNHQNYPKERDTRRKTKKKKKRPSQRHSMHHHSSSRNTGRHGNLTSIRRNQSMSSLNSSSVKHNSMLSTDDSMDLSSMISEDDQSSMSVGFTDMSQLLSWQDQQSDSSEGDEESYNNLVRQNKKSFQKHQRQQYSRDQKGQNLMALTNAPSPSPMMSGKVDGGIIDNDDSEDDERSGPIMNPHHSSAMSYYHHNQEKTRRSYRKNKRQSRNLLSERVLPYGSTDVTEELHFPGAHRSYSSSFAKHQRKRSREIDSMNNMILNGLQRKNRNITYEDEKRQRRNYIGRIKCDQIFRSTKECLSHKGFVHCLVSFVIASIIINTICVNIDNLLQVGFYNENEAVFDQIHYASLNDTKFNSTSTGANSLLSDGTNITSSTTPTMADLYLPSTGRIWTGIIGSVFQFLMVASAYIISKFCCNYTSSSQSQRKNFGTRRRVHFSITFGLLVTGILALVDCEVATDNSIRSSKSSSSLSSSPLVGDLRWCILVVAAIVGPVLDLSTEMAENIVYPISEDTVSSIFYLFANLLSAFFIPLFTLLRNVNASSSQTFFHDNDVNDDGVNNAPNSFDDVNEILAGKTAELHDDVISHGSDKSIEARLYSSSFIMLITLLTFAAIFFVTSATFQEKYKIFDYYGQSISTNNNNEDQCDSSLSTLDDDDRGAKSSNNSRRVYKKKRKRRNNNRLGQKQHLVDGDRNKIDNDNNSSIQHLPLTSPAHSTEKHKYYQSRNKTHQYYQNPYVSSSSSFSKNVFNS